MKKLKLSIVLMIALVGSVVMTGCGPDDPNDPDPKPTLNFLGGSEYVSSNTSLPVSTDFKVGIEAKHESRLDKLEISVSYNGGPRVTPVNCTMCDSSLNSRELSAVFNSKTNNSAGKEEWFFAVIDRNGVKTEKSITITTTAPSKPITKVNVSLGNQDATLGSSLALDIAEVLTLANAKAESARVDLIYVKDDVDMHILCAPSASVAAEWLGGTSGVSTWGTRNASQLRRTALTDVEFEAMTDNSKLVAELSDMSAASDEVKNLMEGEVLVVSPVSNNGLSCLVLIESINVDNTMTIKCAFEQ